jgi:uncharacterized protein
MTTEDVTFDSGGCALAGTYVEAEHPTAAALLITGSGKTDRDSDAALPLGLTLRIGVSSFVADAMQAAGVSSLRYDKRGVGKSGGDCYRTGMTQRLADARAALDWLRHRSGGLPLIAIGHSEGTFYAARLAADGALAGAILLSGPTHTGGEVLAWQTREIAGTLPASTQMIVRLLRVDVVKAQRKNQDKVMASAADVIRVQGQKVNARWLRDFVTYDPAPVLARITVPVLAITGGHDQQVQPDDVEAMRGLVRGPFEGHVAGDLSHLLRPDPHSLGPRGYRRAGRQPMGSEVLDLIASWVTQHWGQSPASAAERQEIR